MSKRPVLSSLLPSILLGALGALGALAACDGDGGAPGDACGSAPLSAWCSDKACPTYDQSVAELRAWAMRTQPPCVFAGIGTCDGLRIVSARNIFGGADQYFDSNGNLVGVYGFSDYPTYCNSTLFGLKYGNVPGCPLRYTEMLCIAAAADGGTRD